MAGPSGTKLILYCFCFLLKIFLLLFGFFLNKNPFLLITDYAYQYVPSKACRLLALVF